MVRRSSNVHRPAELLGKILKTHGLEHGFRRGKALALWPKVAGEMLAQMSEAAALEDGVLMVYVPDSAAAFHLKFQREEFLRRYEKHLPGTVTDIRFRERRLVGKAADKAQPAPPPPLSPEEEARLRALADKTPGELKAAVYRAARAVLQRQKLSPHPPCVICGSPEPENPCKNCQRLLGDPAVKREASRLIRKPLHPRLEGEPLQAAKYLAQMRLEAQLRELLPQVVKEPHLVAVLQDTARRYLQLRAGQPEVRPYLHLLPETLRQFLKEL
ncbi:MULTISPECIES: DUF721 domain-containing protein [unclassified Meiothermus]|uniref:DUF721 domain-containing protein n=1 Tax=unclassified Meiothermus TaxID=370471 RepID=UPI000D7B9645|nr:MULTISPECIES: DUF721 domain-containing protein [unclassified Meiothermus]PZA08114.1 DUF721 domain-containing protein [Meiothermus sp. Pnk-1]RYM29965.1 DUF721 domain-containing protein [Meiothermus sp. PNK-Is4]